MKKNMKNIIIGVIIIIIVSIFVIVIINNKNKNNNSKNYTRPNYDYTAVIYHSEMSGIDAGTNYIYYIYKVEKSDNEYFYIKSKSNITIAGQDKEKDINSGSLNNKDDFTYVNNGNNEELNSINELENKLLK